MISSRALTYVRTRATQSMKSVCRVERVQGPSFDEFSGVATPGGRTVLYTGICRIWEVSGGSAVEINGDDVVIQSTQLSIPWDVTADIRRNDEIVITSSSTDTMLVGARFRVMSVARAGELRPTRRFEIQRVADKNLS